MKTYDVIVIGAGVGFSLAFKALEKNMSLALVDKGNAGGTCINVGCLPSKMLIYPADRIMDIREAEKLGIEAGITKIDFQAIMARMRAAVSESREWMSKEIRNAQGLDFYHSEARFTGDCTLETGGETIRGRKIFIASGARPFIPPVEGLEATGYLTNESVLDLKELPDSLIIMGGGYIGVEYAHFFAALGSRVTIIQRNRTLVPNEEPEISDLLLKELSKRINILTLTDPVKVRKNSNGCTMTVRDLGTGEERDLHASSVMVATGRVSNADILAVEKTGVETDGNNYIRVDDTLRTNRKNIWAFGDAIGKQMFTHAGDLEQRVAWQNATSRKKTRIDFTLVPHAVFTHPQIASVGLTEAQARKNRSVLVGRANYSDVVMGGAMMESESFAKAIIEKDTNKILGFHVIGREAAVLIQEVVNAMALGGGTKTITENMHIFPALSEVVPEALNNLEEPK